MRAIVDDATAALIGRCMLSLLADSRRRFRTGAKVRAIECRQKMSFRGPNYLPLGDFDPVLTHHIHRY